MRQSGMPVGMQMPTILLGNNVLPLQSNMTCMIKDHFNDQLEFVCTLSNCTAENRMCCSYCKYKYHGNHLGSTVQLRDFAFKTIKDSELLIKRMQEFHAAGDIGVIIEQKIEKNIKDNIDSILKKFNMYFQDQMERLSQYMYEHSYIHNKDKNNEAILNQIPRFNDHVYQILHKNWRNQSKEDIQLMTKIYRNVNYCEFFSDRDTNENVPYFANVNKRIDQFYLDVNQLLAQLMEDLNWKTQELEPQNNYQNLLVAAPPRRLINQSPSSNQLASPVPVRGVSGGSTITYEQNSSPLTVRKFPQQADNSFYQPSFTHSNITNRKKSPIMRVGGGYAYDRNAGVAGPGKNLVTDHSILAQPLDQQNSRYFMDQSNISNFSSPKRNNSMATRVNHPYGMPLNTSRLSNDKSRDRILPSLLDNEDSLSGIRSARTNLNNPNNRYASSGRNNSDIDPRRKNYQTLDYNEMPKDLQQPKDSSILVIGLDHIQARNKFNNSNKNLNSNHKPALSELEDTSIGPNGETYNFRRRGQPKDGDNSGNAAAAGGNNEASGVPRNRGGIGGAAPNGNNSNSNTKPNGSDANNSLRPDSSSHNNGNPNMNISPQKPINNNSNAQNNQGLNGDGSGSQNAGNDGDKIDPNANNNIKQDQGKVKQPLEPWVDFFQSIESRMNQPVIQKVQSELGPFKPKPYPIAQQEKNLMQKMPKTRQGIFYEGQWLNGNREGFGICVLPDGSRYEGNWENDQASGYGRMIHANGNVYQGEWQKGKANGYGFFNYANGTQYVGYWKDDLYNGQGLKTWVNGSSYEGQYKDGMRSGQGKFCWPDGSRYQGQFDMNQISGHGVYNWHDGRCYVGEWRQGQMNGKGIFKWADGRSYQGDYVDDKKEGFGIFVWPGGDKQYEGGWRLDQPHGIGILTDQLGNRKKGEWVDGKNIKWFDEVV